MSVEMASTPAGAPPGTRRQRRQAWLVTSTVLLFVVIQWSDKAILGLVAQPVMRELGLTAAEFGLLGSAFSFLFSITALLGGMIADRTSLRWTMFVLAGLWSLTAVPVLVAGTFGALLASRIALGAAEGPAAGVAHTFTYTWFPDDRRGLPAAILTSGASIAKIVCAPLLAVVVVAFGWRAGFVVLAVVGLLWWVPWLLLGRTGPFADTKSAAVSVRERPSAPVSLVRVARTGTFVGLVVALFAQLALAAVVLTWLPSYFATVWGFSEVQSGALLGLPSITAMACLLVTGWAVDRMLRRGAGSRRARGVVGGVTMTLGGVALVVIPFVGSPVVGLALLLVGYGLVAGLQAVANPALAEIVPAARRASLLGLFIAVGSLGGVLAPWLTGVVLDAAPDPATGFATAFQIFGLMVVVGGLLCWWLVDPERDAELLRR